MEPTVFGLMIFAAALYLMSASITAMLFLVLFSSLLGAASAINLPALGGANITPASFALLFLVIRLFLSPAGSFPNVAKAFRENIFLASFCIYGAATAFLLPILFAHTMNVPQLRLFVATGNLFDAYPVEFSSQNITTAVYMLGTFLACLSTCIACELEHKSKQIITAVIAVSWLHVGFGVLDIVLSSAGLHDLLDIFRNGSYLQLDQDIGGIQRVAGIFPETSSYAGYGFWFLVLNTELWLRAVRPRATRAAALALLIILVMSTSSTAYVSIAAYAIVLLARMLFTPMRLPFAKRLGLTAIGLITAVIALTLEVFLPSFSALLLNILQQMTLQKLNSVSGLQRGFWAHKGWEAFWNTYWIGIGAGSFRSSGLLPAIAGSLGILGILTFAGSVWTALRPLRRQTHDVQISDGTEINSAFGWAAAIGLIPLLLSAPTPDPGLLFGIFAGIAVSKMRDIRAETRNVKVYFNAEADHRPVWQASNDLNI